jgi:hypothetical protein
VSHQVWDEVVTIADVIRSAAHSVGPKPGDKSFLEKRFAAMLGGFLQEQLDPERVLINRRLPGFEIPGWDPQPGSFDLAIVDDREQPLAVFELKLDDVDQTLWDVFKVANSLDYSTIEAAYVIAAAPEAVWHSNLEMVDLFRAESDNEWYSRFLLERYHKAWSALLRGGRARPWKVPRTLYTTHVIATRVKNFPPYELRALQITATDDWLPVIDGWPPKKVDEDEIPDGELSLAAVAGPDAPELALHEFALTTNGYERMGSFKRCADSANEALERWRRSRDLPLTLVELRCCLFFEQRRWHHYGYGFDDEAMEYVRAIVAAIRLLTCQRT